MANYSEAVQLLRSIREQDYLSETMRHRIDRLLTEDLKSVSVPELTADDRALYETFEKARAGSTRPAGTLRGIHAVLDKLRQGGETVADERRALTRQDIFDRFQFLEGLVNAHWYTKIAETAITIYESGAPWSAMADTIRDLRAELGYVAQYGERVLPNMCPPATSRDRWMYEQGRLAERAALASAPVAGEAQKPFAWVQEVPGYEPRVFLATRIEDPRRGAWRPEVKWRALVLADAAPQASEAVRNAALAAASSEVESVSITYTEFPSGWKRSRPKDRPAAAAAIAEATQKIRALKSE